MRYKQQQQQQCVADVSSGDTCRRNNPSLSYVHPSVEMDREARLHDRQVHHSWAILKAMTTINKWMIFISNLVKKMHGPPKSTTRTRMNLVVVDGGGGGLTWISRRMCKLVNIYRRLRSLL